MGWFMFSLEGCVAVPLLNFTSQVSFVAFAGLALFSVRGVATTTAGLRKSGRLGVAKRMVKLFVFFWRKNDFPLKNGHIAGLVKYFFHILVDRLRRSAEFIQKQQCWDVVVF